MRWEALSILSSLPFFGIWGIAWRSLIFLPPPSSFFLRTLGRACMGGQPRPHWRLRCGCIARPHTRRGRRTRRSSRECLIRLRGRGGKRDGRATHTRGLPRGFGIKIDVKNAWLQKKGNSVWKQLHNVGLLSSQLPVRLWQGIVGLGKQRERVGGGNFQNIRPSPRVPKSASPPTPISPYFL